MLSEGEDANRPQKDAHRHSFKKALIQLAGGFGRVIGAAEDDGESENGRYRVKIFRRLRFRKKIAHKSVADGAVGKYHNPLQGNGAYALQGIKGANRGKKDAQNKPKGEEVFHFVFRAVAGDDAAQRQKTVDEDHHVKIIEMLLVVKEN